MLFLDGAYVVATEPPVSGESHRRVRQSCKRSSNGWPNASAAHSNAKAS
jgi:hypothetical protein